MQFQPKTEEQIAAENVRPVGIYDFRVLSAEEKVSKSSGKPMIQVDLECFDHEGVPFRVRDYIMESMPHKLRHFCFAVGVGSEYESGKLDASVLPDRGGKVQIKIEPANGQYGPKNAVKDYCKPSAATPLDEIPA